MRNLSTWTTLLLLLLVFIMALCPLCGNDFTAGRGLSIHVGKCKGRDALHSAGIQHAESEAVRAAIPSEPENIPGVSK